MMTAEGRKQLIQTLLAKLRSKSWYWLYRQADLKRGLEQTRQVRLESASLTGHDLEVLMKTVSASASAGRSMGVVLRMTDAGNLSITTICESCGRTHCWHSAALLACLSENPAGATVMELVEEAKERMPLEESVIAVKKETMLKAAALPLIEMRDVEMQPVMLLKRIEAQVKELSRKTLKMTSKTVHLGVAVPMLTYEGCGERFYLATNRLVSHYEFTREDGRRVRLFRDFYRERSLLTEMRMLELEPFGTVMPDAVVKDVTTGCLTVPRDRQALYWAHFRESMVPALMEAGWQVEVADDFGYEIVEPDEGSWFTEMEEETFGENDWFSLNIGFQVDGQRISLVPVLSRALDEGLTVEVLGDAAEEGKAFLLVLDLPGDPVVEVPAKRLLPLIRFLNELMSTLPRSGTGRGSDPLLGGGGLRVDRLRAAQLTEIDGMAINAPPALAHLRERLMAFEEMKLVEVPAELRADLRPYQLEGVSWLQFLREFDLHGVLADDMGLGKTLQTITHLLKEKMDGRADRPDLVVAPTSVVRNWVREMKKFAPDLKVLLLHGAERKGQFKKIASHDVVVTTFPLLVRDVEVLKKTKWHVLALDEAQNIKNPKSQAAQSARELEARHRLCLTGTPMENHLGELWSLFEYLMPGFLGDAETFRKVYRNPIEKKQDVERQGMLARRVAPLMLRRTKDAVAKDLPPKTEIIHRIEIEGPQADLYETIRAVMDQRVREAIATQGMDRSHIVVLDALLKLRQVCCHPALLKVEVAQLVKQSAKLEFLMEDMLPELLEEGRRVLIFSQFTEMLALIEKGLTDRKIQFVKLTGDTKDRETPVRQFQAEEVPVFLISLKAGGAGLNLTAADTVIHYDPWWNPAVEAQASDRAHRIGQTKPVFIHKLICEGTIEEKILEMQHTKAAILEGLMGGKMEKLKLTQEDVQRLLEPL
jgi:hypothetical protein